MRRLRALGIPILVGHHEDNLADAEVLVVSSAIQADNPEVKAARERLMPVVRRAEMLGELMRLKWAVAVGGTHGKTTTTSMIAAMLETAGIDPTVINGGIINAYGTNARLGSGDWMVVEADESDGTFVKLPATICVVTNIDPEHLDFYGSFDKVRDAYASFVQNIPFCGIAALCIDHPEVQALIPRVLDRKIITYGMSPQADVRACDVVLGPTGSRYTVTIADRFRGEERRYEGLVLPMLGQHNVQNSLAAITIAYEMGMDEATIRRALAGFAGVKRRLTVTGEVGGIRVIDDYGHHPVEIAAVMRAVRTACHGRVIAVMQPHRYTRLRDLFEDFCTCFNEADAVIVADIYAAGEQPIEGVSRDALVEGLRSHGHRKVISLSDPAALAGIVAETAEPGDVVVCVGAGSITNWANALPGELDELFSRRAGQRSGANG